VPEDISEAELAVLQQLNQPLPVWAPHKLRDGVGLAAINGMWGDVEVTARGAQMVVAAAVHLGICGMSMMILGLLVYYA